MVFELGLHDDAVDDEDDPNAQEEQQVEEEPLVVDDKPFNMKKFRDSLRKSDCIMGKY